MAIGRFSAPAVAATLLLICVAVSLISAQTRSHTSSELSVADLMNELRALRAEVQQTSVTNLQASLLLGRVQLQQAQINSVAWQLSEVRRTLQGYDAKTAKPLGLIRYADDIASRGQTLLGYDEALAEARAEVARLEQEEMPLRNQETQLANQLSTEQQRWAEFSRRLDELERAAGKSAPKQ